MWVSRQRGRLERLHAAVCPNDAAVHSDDNLLQQGGGVGLPHARQDVSGALTAESIRGLEAAMASAAARQDFRVAALLKTMLDVLGPRTDHSSLDLQCYTSTQPDEAADLLLEHGFVVLPNVISPQDLSQMRTAYEAVAASHRQAFDALWTRGAEPRRDLGKSYKFPLQLDKSTTYHPLLAPPLLIEVLHRALGQPPVVSSLNEGLGGFVIPAADGHTPEPGYISWHRDR